MILTQTSQAIELQAKLFRGFSDSSRLAILRALLDGPHTVGEIVEMTGLSQPNTSNHLACLRDCGLVTTEPDGRFVYYALSDKRIAQLLRLTDEILAEVAKGIYECVRYEKPRTFVRKSGAVRSGKAMRRVR